MSIFCHCFSNCFLQISAQNLNFHAKIIIDSNLAEYFSLAMYPPSNPQIPKNPTYSKLFLNTVLPYCIFSSSHVHHFSSWSKQMHLCCNLIVICDDAGLTTKGPCTLYSYLVQERRKNREKRVSIERKSKVGIRYRLFYEVQLFFQAIVRKFFWLWPAEVHVKRSVRKKAGGAYSSRVVCNVVFRVRTTIITQQYYNKADALAFTTPFLLSQPRGLA